MTSDSGTEKRVLFDFEVDFSNGGGIQGQGFRLDIEGDDTTDQELARYIVRDLHLLMVGTVRILNKQIIVEKHKRAQAESPWSNLLRSVAERATCYRESLVERRVTPLPESVARLAELGGPLPPQPNDAETILALLWTRSVLRRQ